VTTPRPNLHDRGNELPARDGERRTGTVRLASILGADNALSPDPAEDYHEASRLYPRLVDPYVTGAARLESSPELRISAARSVKRHEHLPFVSLPQGDLGSARLADVLRTRRSRRTYGEGELAVGELATLLEAAYGVTGAIPGTSQALRSAPSGGALYPLELYVVAQRVEDVERGLYHYDPLRHGLERLGEIGSGESIGELTPYPALLADSGAFVVATAMLWRSRFKYGQRAYRFALLEAGHVGQSLLLAAEAMGLAATPVGGFFDSRVDAFLGIDGLTEVALYMLPVGGRPA
jgi:SagB-type dehydrogenase family enzyme